ncbi:PREDICTED: uncharacterized protein LOC105462776 [Wasmannia auropunctata]|uniref:uncharacterized protein LOC105462776 n=1 Tax=Wasmannia auropunctata TaxID=64793 RepID=UPI0005EE737C|nr:PREDICTED: uncharacterized protein LOC105462776 [Wasmannia auropunctata]
MSNNIKGSITRKMKLNVATVAEITKIISMRASQEGDIGFMRARFADMQSEINGLREENQRLKLQMEEIQSGLNIRTSPTGNLDLGRGATPVRMEISPNPPLGLGSIISGAVAKAIWTQLPGRGTDGERKHERPRDPLERERPRGEEGWGSSSAIMDSQAVETEDYSPLPQRKGATRRQRRRERRIRRRMMGDPTGDMADVINRPGYSEDYLPLPEVERGDKQPRPVREGTRFLQREERAHEGIQRFRGKITLPAADSLAKKLREAFKDTNIQIRRPTLRGELRLAGLHASVTTEELIETLAKEGGCNVANVRLGSFRLARSGLRTVWLQCPLDTATRLAETGRLRVGWSTALVTLLKRRPMQCFRCFATCHVRDSYPSEVDRTDKCFNCCEAGHTMRDCGRPPCCPICREKSLNYNHRAGSEVCPPCPPRRDLCRSPRRGETQANRNNVAEERTIQWGTGSVDANYAGAGMWISLHIGAVSVPKNPGWARSREQTPMAAMLWSEDGLMDATSTLKMSDGYVMASWGKLIVVLCYFSPNKSINQFRAYLAEVGNYLNHPLLILGDFNARSNIWDDTHPTVRGDTITTWASTLDFRLLNNNNEPTCVRPQGKSVIDLSWASPAALRLIDSWEVATEEEILSDHKYIYLNLKREQQWQNGDLMRIRHLKWNRKSLNPDLLRAGVGTFLWPKQGDNSDNLSAEERARQLQTMMTEASDLAMKRQRPGPKRAVYWWSSDIADLRKKCISLRRRVIRVHRRNGGAAPELEVGLLQARKALRTAIKTAKNTAWNELLSTINRDPWGCPYKLVMDKLRPAARPVCETLPLNNIREIVARLFPHREEELLEKPRQYAQPGTTAIEVRKATVPILSRCNLHTLGGCRAWDGDRQALASVIGKDMSLGAVMAAILRTRENWIAFGKFSENVMLRKEEAERARQAEAHGAGNQMVYSEEEDE